MARALFGGSDDDRVESIYGLGSKKLTALAPGIALTFWSDPVGGEQITDLLSATWDDAADDWAAGDAIEQVTSDDEGYYPSFFGPDGVLGMWAQAGSSSRRFRVQTMDAAAVQAAVDAAQLAAQQAQAVGTTNDTITKGLIDDPDSATSGALKTAIAEQVGPAVDTALADSQTIQDAAEAAVDGELASAGVLHASAAPTLSSNRAPDPQLKTSGGTNSASQYPLSRITAGLPTGISYGVETARAGSPNATISSMFVGSGAAGSESDPLRWIVTPGETVSVGVDVWTDQAGAEARVDLIYKTATGTTVGSTVTGTYSAIAQNTWERRSILGNVVPVGAAYVYGSVTIRLVGGSGTTVVGAKGRVTAAQLVSGAALPDYGDGTTQGWVWLGAAHASQSKKVFLDTTEYDQIGNGEPIQAGSEISPRVLKEWTAAEAWEPLTITRDTTTGLVATIAVKWPDGSLGTFTPIAVNSTHVAIDAYSISHADSAKTVTQPAVTRDATGAVTDKPALTVA